MKTWEIPFVKTTLVRIQAETIEQAIQQADKLWDFEFSDYDFYDDIYEVGGNENDD